MGLVPMACDPSLTATQPLHRAPLRGCRCDFRATPVASNMLAGANLQVQPLKRLFGDWNRASSISSIDPNVSYGWSWFLPESERKKSPHFVHNDVAVLNYRNV